MSTAKKIIAILILTIILLITGGAVYLSQANLAPLALGLAKSRMGLDIKADNPTLKLFPSLTFSADNLTVPGLNGDGSTLLQARAVNATIGWSAFPRFWTSPRLNNLELADATLTLIQPQSGAPNWQFVGAGQPNNAASGPDTAPQTGTGKGTFALPTFGTINLSNVDISYDNKQTNQKAEVENLNLNINGEDLAKLRAELSATLNGRPLAGTITTDATNLQEIGLKGRLSFGSTNATVDGTVTGQSTIAGQVSVQTDNLRRSVQEVLTTAPATTPAEALRLTTYLKSDGKTYSVNNLSLSLGELLRLTGSLEGGIQPVTAKGNVNLRTNNLRTLAAAVQGAAQPQIPSAPFSAASEVDFDGSKVKLSNLTATLADILILNGTLTSAVDGTQASTELTLQGSDLARLGKILPQLQGQTLPASPFTANAVATVGGQKVNVPTLALNIPNALNVTGDLAATLGTVPHVIANLTVARADLAALGLCAATKPQPAAPAGSGNAPSAAASAPWSDDPLALDALASVTGQLSLKATNINCPSWPVQGATLNVANTAEALDITSLSVSLLPSGQATVQGRVGHAGGTLQPNVKLALDNYPAESLLPKASWSNGLAMPLDAAAELQSSGKTTRQLAQNLGGSVKADTRTGRLPAADTINTLLMLESILGGGAPQQQAATRQDINQFRAEYTIANGIATATNLRMEAANNRIGMTGTGTVNLPAWTVSHTMLATVGNQQNIPVIVNGNLSAPHVGLDPAYQKRMQDRLLREGGKAVNKLLGGGEAGARTNAVTEALGGFLSGEGVNEQGVQNLFNAFGGKKQQPAAEPTPTTEETPAEEQPVATPTPTSTQPQNPLEDVIRGFINP